MKTEHAKKETPRPPVVVVMGHIDHGKSSLLDYIRKTNTTLNEAGGITQNISAYEVIHKDEYGVDRKITFLDTPGHEAFSKMRERGAAIADVAILIVSAAEGVQPQTIEAWKTIVEMKLPSIVAINKIDLGNANIEKTKKELAENEIYLENYGGKIPCAEISAKVGTGVDTLLSLILILSDMENFAGNTEEDASGFVIEADLDAKRGIQATLIIKKGFLQKGMFVVVEDAIVSTRTIQNFKGEMIESASASSPIRLSGFNKIPKVGAPFKTFKNKKDAEKYRDEWEKTGASKEKNREVGVATSSKQESTPKIIPIFLKTDVAGSLEAIEKEIAKIKSLGTNELEGGRAEFKIVSRGVGPISESEIKNISNSENAIVIGFNVKADKSAVEIAKKRGITISFFDVIYKLKEWLEAQMEEKRPRIETIETSGRAKIIRAFSRTKERQIIGGKVITGEMLINGTVKILRREFEIGRGKIVNLEKGKIKTSSVPQGAEFGMMIESKIEIAPGDIIELFSIVQK
ncbi:MAG TPA: translation initiation factor IF-2 [Candidatus Paceibacterota bacterium]|nr:translation initiation factor IF-2 [Candidatus Paceibacterota bacterium]